MAFSKLTSTSGVGVGGVGARKTHVLAYLRIGAMNAPVPAARSVRYQLQCGAAACESQAFHGGVVWQQTADLTQQLIPHQNDLGDLRNDLGDFDGNS